MEFFNKKQDVVELKLTQFGRNLLSRGKFKPVYYSFFDDNILYDSQKAGFAEQQNQSEERIKEAQTMRTQVSFTSLEKEFQLLQDHYSENRYDNLQKSAEKNYLLPSPIGTMHTNSEYAPAWNVKFLKGSITGSSTSLSLNGTGPSSITGSKLVLNIPQIESIVEVATFGNSKSPSEAEDVLMPGTTIISNAEEAFIMLKFIEENAPNQKTNFDMEIFEIEEETTNGVTSETLRSLAFIPKNYTNSQILENIGPEANQSYADYYFDIRVDNEIGDKVICKYDPIKDNKTRAGIFAEKDAANCDEVMSKDTDRTFDIYEDEEDYPGEIC